jgi:signal peptidase I
MHNHNRQLQRLGNALAFGLIAVLWLLFAPQHLGGQAAFVIVNGNSMEPVYYRGDLVIAHAAETYAIGDIVTYRHPEIGPVIHRIIGRDGERWIFQGDNNDFIDPYRPTQDEFIGRSWLHFPEIGNRLMSVGRSPWIPILAFGTVFMTIMGTKPKAPRAHKRHRRPQPDRPAGSGQNSEWLPTFFGILSLAGIALTVFAYFQPVATEENALIDYRQQGRFDYSAAAPVGVYDAEFAGTGEPIFFQLSSQAQIRFDYRFESAAPTTLHGTYAFPLELSSSNGWRRTIPLVSEQPFEGSEVTIAGELDLQQIRNLIEQYETATALERQQYELTLAPQIRIEGTLDQLPLREEFAPRLVFKLDDVQLRINPNDSGIEAQLNPERSAFLNRSFSAPNRIGLFGIEFDVVRVRQIGFIVMVTGIIFTVASGLPLVRMARRDEYTRAKLKYGALIVDTVDGTPDSGQRVVNLASIDDLARLAERYGATILHDGKAVPERYVLYDGETAYVYQSQPARRIADTANARTEGSGGENTRTVDPDVVPAMVNKTVQADGSGSVPDTAGEADGRDPSPPVYTPDDWHAVFLRTLHDTGLATEAARVAGVDIAMAYREREHSSEFAGAWRAARIYSSRQFNAKGNRR